mmetsp:Transcript_122404/g.341494  ORF Transcript_122404/g.341494 Transcript_122404/m.341494 type:complete len:333 (-) Transcript_122404:63-1061(-)
MKKYAATLTTLDISRADARKLFELFFRCDDDDSGEISIKEFFEFVELERTKFAKRAFSLFDQDGSGQIDFREWVVSMWNYCTFTKQALVDFAFDLYDLDGSGEIDLAEMQLIVKEVYGDNFRTSVYAKKIMEKVHEMGSRNAETGVPPQITRDQFAIFAQKHPAMLFPAFRLQQELQKKCLGMGFWKKAGKTRNKLFSDATDIKSFMSKVNESAFRDLVGDDGTTEVEPFSEGKDALSPKDMRKVKSMHPAAAGGAGAREERDSSKRRASHLRSVQTYGGDSKSMRKAAGGGGSKSMKRRASARHDGSSRRGGPPGTAKVKKSKVRPSAVDM